ncbi:MAG: hypothetical protein RIR18_1126 [Pseudomonadota bacterium]|jgi:16S rRNA (cytidine1402-2'-O)-methyltransferase
MSTGTLYLIPVPLGATSCEAVLPTPVLETVHSLTHFVAENAKSARAFLKIAKTPHALQTIAIEELNEHTPPQALQQLLAPLLTGHHVGLISEAGCPAVADPGAGLVALAHAHKITVIPLVGPSSLLLALMASGLGGQHFAFHGYLPAQTEQRLKQLRALEKISSQEKQTQLFIETPYRNKAMLDSLLSACQPGTQLCLATDLTLPSEKIVTQTIAQWQKAPPPDIDRRPTVFLLLA